MTLDNLEMLIAFAVVMLGVSLLITVLTQMVATLLGSRGTNLRWALIQLIETIHPQFKREVGTIVDRVLTNPLISDSSLSTLAAKIPVPGRWRLASAIRVEELIGILEKLSAGTTPLPAGASASAGYTIEQAMATIARDARANAGLELDALAAQVKQFLGAIAPSAAGTAAGGSSGSTSTGSSGGGSTTTGTALTLQPTVKIEELIGKIPADGQTVLRDLKAWFDSAMDRASQRFALHMRVWTIVFAIVMAFCLKLDSFDLLGRLSTDAALRTSLASSYAVLSQKAGQLSPTSPEMKPTIEELGKQAAAIRTELEKSKFRLIPEPYDAVNVWSTGRRFWGVLFSAAMLSLGAPFWFNTLKTLTNLRPLLANKQDKEKKPIPAPA